MIEKDKQAPEFSCENQKGESKSLTDYKGKYLVIYFYPKDNTPGCTKEANEFSDRYDEFSKRNTEVIGVSKDTVKSHYKFCDKFGLKMDLLSDVNGEMIETYGAWQEKSMYGKTYMGIQRSTVLISPEGKVIEIWPKVKVKGHVEEVLATLSNQH